MPQHRNTFWKFYNQEQSYMKSTLTSEFGQGNIFDIKLNWNRFFYQWTPQKLFRIGVSIGELEQDILRELDNHIKARHDAFTSTR